MTYFSPNYREKYEQLAVFLDDDPIPSAALEVNSFDIRDIYSAPLGGGGGIFVQIGNREEFEGGLEKRKGKGRKRRKKRKELKYLYEA